MHIVFSVELTIFELLLLDLNTILANCCIQACGVDRVYALLIRTNLSTINLSIN